MVKNREKSKSEFAKRLHLCLDTMRVPARGRLTAVAKMFDVSISGARKWLEGDAYPDTYRMETFAEVLSVRSQWLFTGKLDDIDERLGHRLQQCIGDRNFIHESLAKRSGVPLHAILNACAGRYRLTDAEYARLGKVLDYSIAQMQRIYINEDNTPEYHDGDIQRLPSSSVKALGKNASGPSELSTAQKRIAEQMRRNDLHPDDLALLTRGEIDAGAIAQWLRGQAEPSGDELKIIASHLGMPADYFRTAAPSKAEIEQLRRDRPTPYPDRPEQINMAMVEDMAQRVSNATGADLRDIRNIITDAIADHYASARPDNIAAAEVAMRRMEAEEGVRMPEPQRQQALRKLAARISSKLSPRKSKESDHEGDIAANGEEINR